MAIGSFRADSLKDAGAWIVPTVDAEVRPGFEMVWGKE
jgi:hypothetical protein